MGIFNATCISVLLYGCESWTLTEASSEKLNCLVRTFYRITCGIKQSESHMTNEQLFAIVNQRPIAEELRKRQLKFIGHCLRMPPEELTNIYALYQSRVREKNKSGRPTAKYIEHISQFITSDCRLKLTAEISKYTSDKRSWSSLITEAKKPVR
ncbi:unnamed protein product [Brachionus calyciflorus]|uniref:Uncharacterized protein n=1 Tax=Brachionus calyciflorus TaxID=104777 RepID=A0A813R1E5_9BILA|nr:unnamed protein product [Brachionus calyciflorus]